MQGYEKPSSPAVAVAGECIDPKEQKENTSSENLSNQKMAGYLVRGVPQDFPGTSV